MRWRGPQAVLWEKLELLGRFGLPIRVTEFGVRASDPHLHAEDMLRLLEVCFAHPRVVGVHFWISWEPDMWPRDKPVREAPLWNADWSPRPAGEAFIDLVTRRWSTEGSATVGAQGEVSFRGFFGRYRIRAGEQDWTADLTAETPSLSVWVHGKQSPAKRE